VSKRRRFTPDLNAQVVLEDLTGARSTAEICRERQLGPQLLSRWKAEFLTHAPEIFAREQSRREEQQHIADLERMVGRLTMELEAARRASSIMTSLSTRNGN
jgi:transposase